MWIIVLSVLLIYCLFVNFSLMLVLWEVFGDCANYDVLKGHKNAILEVVWAQDNQYAT